MFCSTGLHLSSSAHIFPTRNPNGEKRERECERIQSAFYFFSVPSSSRMNASFPRKFRTPNIHFHLIHKIFKLNHSWEGERTWERSQFRVKISFLSQQEAEMPTFFCELTAPPMLLFFGPSPPYASCLDLNDLFPLSLSCRKSFTTQEICGDQHLELLCTFWLALFTALLWWSKRMQLTLKWEFLYVWILDAFKSIVDERYPSGVKQITHN